MRAFRNIVAYMGFGFYWAWIFVSFNSVGSLGQNLSIDALTSSHLASSVAAILPLLAAFLLRGKIEALPHRALFALVVSSSALASVSTACMQAFFAQPIMHAVARCQECGYLHRSFVRVCRARLFRYIVYAVVRRRFCCDGVAPRYRT